MRSSPSAKARQSPPQRGHVPVDPRGLRRKALADGREAQRREGRRVVGGGLRREEARGDHVLQVLGELGPEVRRVSSSCSASIAAGPRIGGSGIARPKSGSVGV